MKLNEPPNCVTKTVEFSAAVVDYVDAEDNQNKIYPLIGGLSRDNHYAWISRGPTFEVVATESGEKIAAWTFGGILKDTNTKVTCAVELPTVENGYGTSVSSLYAVGLDCYLSNGMVCLFDIRGSKIIKAIQVPGKVTSLALVDPGLIPEATTPLAPPLRLARGVLAVGLSPGGQVLLLDLCLSEEDGAVTEGAPPGEEEYMCGTARPHLEHSDELNPSTVVVHAPGDPGTEGPVAPGEHLAIFLNEQSFVNNYFMLKLSESPSCMYRLPPSHVDITASLYVPQLASLFIGFSFGCFQVWDLGNLSLVHTSSLLAEPRNITFFAFQEPADDPKKYCYIWAVYGRKWDKGHKEGEARKGGSTSEAGESESQDDLAFAFMHDMYYHSKEWIDAYGWIYQDFVSINRRFELELSLGDAARSVSRCVSCCSLDGNLGRGRAPYLGRLETGEFDEVSSAENDLSLCCLVWQSWQVAEDGTPCNLQHSLTLFDLNQWYREQMPFGASPLILFSSDLSGDYSEGVSSHPGHPHLVTYTLPFVTERTMSGNGIPLLFARINPRSISRFCPAAVPIPEEHLFPSALAFESSFLLGSQCVIKMSTPGLQRSLLATLQNRGSKTYLYPSALFHECIAAGLKPLYVDIHNPATTPVAEQRKFLLSLALEYHMLAYLIRCAVDTADGCASSLGVTLDFLMSWVKHRSCVIRECINKLSKPLFECGGTLLPDPQAARLMALCGRQLNHLSTLLKEILKRCVSWIFVNELKEIEKWCDVLGILALHAEVVQWFCHVGLLPELADEDSAAAEIEASNIGAPRLPYPASMLAAIYEERRKELRGLPGVSNVSDILFIDGAVRECGERLTQETWRSMGSEVSGSYPPPSLQALLRTYLLDGLPAKDKHCLVIYLFLDLAGLLDNARYASSISQLIKFPSAFSLSPSIIKLTQAFWLLDHKDFESAINMFLEPLICPQDIKLWQHRCVVRAFLSQGEPQKALKYVRVRQPPLGGLEDLKLNLTLLLENGLVHEAFNYQRKHRNDQNSKELLQHFFEGCGDLKELRWVLQNSLTQSEEKGLISFLTSQKDEKAHELLVMYYLQRSRFIEALHINENERPTKKKEFARGTVDGSRRNMKTVRDAIVTGYASTMPPVTRRLAIYCARHAAAIHSWKEVPRPVPMSVVINQGEANLSFPTVRTKSSLIGTMLDKARETWNPPPLSPLMPPTPRPSLRPPQPPLSMPSSRTKRKREDDESSGIPQLSAKNLFSSPNRSSVELIPFICTPVAPSQSRSRNGDGPPLVFPSQIKSLSNLEDYSTPSKRPCTSLSMQVPTTSSPLETGDTSLGSSALQLLQTPVVPKKNRKTIGIDGLQNDDYSSTGTEGSTPPREKPLRTPHSILKVRKERDITAGSPSFATDNYQAEQEGNQEEGQSLGRLIRFQLPTGLTPSPTLASPMQWPTFNSGSGGSQESDDQMVSTPKSPLSRSPIKSPEQQSTPLKRLQQPSPRMRPSPRTPIQHSPDKNPMLVQVRKEFSSSTKTTTKVKITRESSVENELEGVLQSERKGPRTRSSIHKLVDMSSKKKVETETNGDESGEFYSFEEPKDEEPVEEGEAGSSVTESKRGTMILTDSYIRLFGSPYLEPKRRRSTTIFKRGKEEEDDDEMEDEADEEVQDQNIERTEGTELVDLESEGVEVDEEVEKVADEEIVAEDVGVKGQVVSSSEAQALEHSVHNECMVKGGEVVDEARPDGEVLEDSQEIEESKVEKYEGEIGEAEEVVEINLDGPSPYKALPTKEVLEPGEIVEEGLGKEEEEAYENSGGNAYSIEEDQTDVIELETSEIFSDEIEEGTAKLSTVEEVSSSLEKAEEEGNAIGEINEGHNILEGIEDKEVVEEEGEAMAEQVEGEATAEQVEGHEDEPELKENEEHNSSGKSLEELPPEAEDEEEKQASASEDEAEDDDDDDVVVISSTDEDEDQSDSESVEDEAEKAEEDHEDMMRETEEAKEYWEEYGYEEEMEGYDKKGEEEQSDTHEEREKESWISQWERESGVNQTLWTDQEREEEEEIEEVGEAYVGSEDGNANREDEGRMVRDTAGLEVVGVQIGKPNTEKSTKSLIKGWEEEYGLKEEDLEDQEDLYEEEEEVDEEDEEEDEEEVDEDDEEEVEDDDDEDDDDVEEEDEEDEEDDDGVVELIDDEPKWGVKARVVKREVELSAKDHMVPVREGQSREVAEKEGLPLLMKAPDNIEEKKEEMGESDGEDVIEVPEKVMLIPQSKKHVEVEELGAGDDEDVVEEEPQRTVAPQLRKCEDIEKKMEVMDDVEERNIGEGEEMQMESRLEVEDTFIEDDVLLVEEEKFDVFKKNAQKEGKEEQFKRHAGRKDSAVEIIESEHIVKGVELSRQVSSRKAVRNIAAEVAEPSTVPVQIFPEGGEEGVAVAHTEPLETLEKSADAEEGIKEEERVELVKIKEAVRSITAKVVEVDTEPVKISDEGADVEEVTKEEERVELVRSEEAVGNIVAQVIEPVKELVEIVESADTEEVTKEERIELDRSKGAMENIVAEAVEVLEEIAEVKEVGGMGVPEAVEVHDAEGMETVKAVSTKAAKETEDNDFEMKLEEREMAAIQPEGNVQAIKDEVKAENLKDLEMVEEAGFKHADVDRIILVSEKVESVEGKYVLGGDDKNIVAVKSVVAKEEGHSEGTTSAELDAEANTEEVTTDKSVAVATASGPESKEYREGESKELEMILPAEKEHGGVVTASQPQPSNDDVHENEDNQDQEMVLVLDSDHEDDTSRQEEKGVDVLLLVSEVLTGASPNKNDKENTTQEEGEQTVAVMEQSPNLIVDSSVEKVTPEAEKVEGADSVEVEMTPTQIIEDSAEMEEEIDQETKEKLGDNREGANEEKSEEEELNLSSRIEEYATSRRLTRHQMSLLSRSLGGVESPSTPSSAKRKTKARTPPHSIQKDTTATPSLDTPQSLPLSTTPLRSSARIRSLGNKALSEKSTESQEASKPQESDVKPTTSSEVEVPSEAVPEVKDESPGKVAAESAKALSDEKSSPVPWSLNLEERLKKLKRGSHSANQSTRKTRQSSGKSVSPQSSVSSSHRERAPSESKSVDKDVMEGRAENEVPEAVSDILVPPESPNVAERLKRLKQRSPMVDSLPAGRRTRRISTKSSSPHSSASTEIRLSPFPEVMMQLEDATVATTRASSPTPSVASTVESVRSGRARRRTMRGRASVDREEGGSLVGKPTGEAPHTEEAVMTKADSPTPSLASTEIRLSPVPEVMMQLEDATVAIARASSPTPSVASTVESVRSGRAKRRTTRGRASVDREEGGFLVGKPTGEASHTEEAVMTRVDSPTPSVASTIGSSVSGRVMRSNWKEREDQLSSPIQELQHSGRVRRKSRTESPGTRRSARLRGSSPLTAQALTHERFPPPSDSDSEVSGYSSSAASSRSRLSAVQEVQKATSSPPTEEELVLRSGRKRSKPPVLTPTKSGPRKKRTSRGSSAARFLMMPEENEEEEEAAVNTAFIFSPPKAVLPNPSELDVPKETVEFTLSPPKIVAQPTSVATGRRRTTATRRSIANLDAIPEDGEVVPSVSSPRATHDQTIDVIVPDTPPRRRGRSSIPGSKVSSKNEEPLWSSPRRGGHRGKSKGEVGHMVEEQASQDADVSLSVKKRTRRSSVGSLQTIEESKDEEDSNDGEAEKRLHPILRNKRSSPTGSVVSEGALDQGGDAELKHKDSNRAKDDSDTLPRKRKSLSRKPRKVIVPYKPRKSAKL